MKDRRSWIDVLQKLRDHGCKPKLLYPAMLSFPINGENKIFRDTNNFKQYVATNPALQKVIEGNSVTFLKLSSVLCSGLGTSQTQHFYFMTK